MSDTAVGGAVAPRGGLPAPTLRVGTWNITHWTVAKASVLAASVDADILAIQETHLARVPLQKAHKSARNAGLQLHHGRPSECVAHSEHGKSCGVGFVSRKDVAVAPALPSCPSWRRLHAMRRLHGVRLAPRAGLPHGVLFLAVYAPLPTSPEREAFNTVFLAMTHALDMQVPTFLLGDFNGALLPAEDYRSASGARRPPCALLADLLGPGRPWIDVHRALLPSPLPWTYHHVGPSGEMASRIDLILANGAAMRLVRGAAVQDELGTGGHLPVLVTLSLDPGRIDWHPPQPRVPPLLREPSAALAASAEWADVVERWSRSAEVHVLAAGTQPESLDSLATALRAALEHLVSLAGGWSTRPPRRRLAYDSNRIRLLRDSLADVQRVQTLCMRELDSGWQLLCPGAWPRALLAAIDRLKRWDIVLPLGAPLTEVCATARVEAASRRAELDRLIRQHRSERSKRLREALPRLWKEDVGVIQRWLLPDSVPWGSRPILDDAGLQCLSVAAVDQAVRGFWVDNVLRQHAAVDEDQRWDAFLASPFSAHFPTATWPSSAWSAARVRLALRSMREGAAPGMTGVPIAVWRSLPSPWPEAVARLLNLVEAERRWPSAWLEAYVSMIPKASGGSRPQDQRPITVLEVLYRLWAKGIVTEWGPTLQASLLSDAAFGFRSGRGTLHAAQVVADLLAEQRARRHELWLASFDLKKCFDSLPWWAVFRLLRAVGVEEKVVACFRAFYRDVRRRFRYGAVLGEPWRAANGLAQGCPASPDLLNILFEPFHRWAAAERLGVDVAGLHVASVSFADDLTLIAPTQAALERLIAAYLHWCALLGVEVTKVQAWSSLGPGRAVTVGSGTISTAESFRFVGIELGLPGVRADEAHWQPRLARALDTAERLRGLPLPAALQAVLWRTTVLPKALYGCELREVSAKLLAPLVRAAKAAVCRAPPLALSGWAAAPEICLGWPLGDAAPVHPMYFARLQQLRWLQQLANSSGLAGVLHRAVACRAGRAGRAGGEWREPSRSLREALKFVKWKVVRNTRCARSTCWPALLPEPSFTGDVVLTPSDAPPVEESVFTDGSLSGSNGGAAVWKPNTGETFMLPMPAARSSTHCELVALTLSMQLLPELVLTDSLCALQLIRGWAGFAEARRLSCLDRVEVREFLAAAGACCCPPTLEKVRAHDEEGVQRGAPKAVGNSTVDALAKRAASGEISQSLAPHAADKALGQFGDPVLLLADDGSVVLDAARSFPGAYWRRCRAGWPAGRRRLEMLFPESMEFDRSASVGVFRRPVVQKGAFVPRAAARVVKWLARLRCGCLGTRDRLHRQGVAGVPSPHCLCCGAEAEDDLHVLTGCPVTGSADWLDMLLDAWRAAAAVTETPVPPPLQAWIEAHRLPLLVALIPTTTTAHCPLPDADASRFHSALHAHLAERTAEILRRRGEVMATNPVPAPTASPDPDSPDPDPAAASSSTSFGLRLPCPLPPERRLSVADLREIELRRRDDPDPVGPAPADPSPPPPTAPPSGELRRRWLKERLIRLLRDDTASCPAVNGSSAEVLFLLFEKVTGEPYTQAPGTARASRLSGFGLVLRNLVGKPVLSPPLERAVSHFTPLFSRAPLVQFDVELERARQRRLEASQPPPPPGLSMAQADALLAAMLLDRTRFAEVADAQGETSLALLLLWEAQHEQPFPSTTGSSESSLVAAFTRRLRNLVNRADSALSWLTSSDIHAPLMPGLPPSHCTRWGIKIIAPTDATPWPAYHVFVQRWQERVRALAAAPPPPASGARRPRDAVLFQPAKRHRSDPPTRPPTATAAPATAGTPSQRQPRPRSPTAAADVPRPKRQSNLTCWLQPARSTSPPHGRAAQGPPT